ncbi:MAG: flagellar hook capping FlgD N-terminal domain-containing protein [Roseobacter sp.]
MDILSTTNAVTTSQVAAAESQTTATLSSDFETFLQMLTAQARYQDPLEPIDSSEYAAQLAQFSMVEQQVLSNDLLTDLGSQIGAGNIGQMASWIGMEARSTSEAAFNGNPITVLPTIEAGADDAYLVAYASNGAEVQRRQISTNGSPIEWNGILDNGSQLPDGNYSFSVESRSLGETTGISPAESYSRITEARREGLDTVFVLSSGDTVTSAEVSALREVQL